MDRIRTHCTTKPVVPPYSLQPVIFTSNPKLSLRPYRIDDLAALHKLRSQIEVMQWTSKGTVDEDPDTTRTWMGRFMDPSPNLETCDRPEGIQEGTSSASVDPKFNFVIAYTPDSDHITTSESPDSVIGCCGVHATEPEFECGYMIRKEYWGQGIATAVVKAFTEAWWNLPRRTVHITSEQAREALAHGARSSTDEEQGIQHINEILTALIAEHNIGSQRVLAKCGFQFQSRRTVQERGEEVSLADYILNRPTSTG